MEWVETTARTVDEAKDLLLDQLGVDEQDAESGHGLDVPVFATRTLMRSLDDRVALARFVLDCAAALGSGRRG